MMRLHMRCTVVQTSRFHTNTSHSHLFVPFICDLGILYLQRGRTKKKGSGDMNVPETVRFITVLEYYNHIYL